MQRQSDYRRSVMPQVVRMDDNNVDDNEAEYQRAAGILRDFHSTQTHCCPLLHVIHEDLDDYDDDSSSSSNHSKSDQNERGHLFAFSGLISRSGTVSCLTALAQQEVSDKSTAQQSMRRNKTVGLFQ
jgi:hypothetical protein